MKTNPYIIDYYNNYDEDSRLSPRHGTVEFLTTMRYIEKYIKPAAVFLKSEQEPAGIPMRWRVWDIRLTQ